jgi:multiple sugar transport system substrate-binding protein
MKDRNDRFRVAVRRFAPFEVAMAKQWAAFELEAPTGLQLEVVPMDMQQLSEATLGPEAGNNWDAALVNTDFVATAHQCGALLDLSDLIRSEPPEGYPDAWTPSMLRLQMIDGAVLGLPYHDGPECLIYRRDLFEAAGERLPDTWEDFRRLARTFHRPEKGLYGTVFAAYPDGHNSVYDFCIQLWTRGGELTRANGKFCFDSPQAMEALAFLRKTINDGSAAHPACRELDSVKSGLAFAAGEVAMMVNWFGFAAMAESHHDSKVRGKVGVASIPHAPGSPGTSLNIYWLLSIPFGAVHKETAWQFLRHCAIAKMDKLLTLEGGIGCRRSTWADSEVNTVIPFYSRMEQLHAQTREMPRMAEWPQVAEIIDRMVLAAINTGATIKSIAGDAQAEVQKVLR